MPPNLIRSCLAAIAGLAALPVAPAAAADPVGTWLTEDGRARVRTEPCGPGKIHLCGYVVWGSKPLDETGKPKRDRYNPDPAKQSRPLLGHQMILGLKRNAEGRYVGSIYNGDNGKSYEVTVWSEAPSELSVKGCLLAVLCGTQTWTRVTDLLPGQLQGATDAAGGPRSDPEWIAKPAAPGSKGRPADGSTPAR
ncbi:DUF2147 domain-containing protein [Methylobacterium haplocladii]|uniref:DUF2147 domain-containing protein n=1 Tax=Methylobacterium haplocladii TaxID=1176176 RepID=A0A512IRN2_9HYPH|nr:DUF2147 domain-containing protein [Methylobacterium haplocladii]GEP00341.1 hypothetical protein MHA02_27280 [Methylobacterium haplocladii]GJD85613.1 hypothetical protein HPGCJGGD_3503 [Methylobacterium haplocladii]GLS58453.1 hypothetical protein GCM10007887_11150 [Methylobacterium haplocladii]